MLGQSDQVNLILMFTFLRFPESLLTNKQTYKPTNTHWPQGSDQIVVRNSWAALNSSSLISQFDDSWIPWMPLNMWRILKFNTPYTQLSKLFLYGILNVFIFNLDPLVLFKMSRVFRWSRVCCHVFSGGHVYVVTCLLVVTCMLSRVQYKFP